MTPSHQKKKLFPWKMARNEDDMKIEGEREREREGER
jgi:hypothetical protein